MRSLLFVLSFAVLSFSFSPAVAAEAVLKQGFKVILPSLADLKKLKPYQQELYNQAIRSLLNELSQSQFNKGAKFAQQQSWLMSSAYAAEGDECTNAGWLVKRDVSGFCDVPRCPGQPSMILCKPILYGENVCVSPSGDATSDCDRSARDPAKIKAYRDAHAGEWMGVQNEMNNYCATGQGADACSLVITRLNEARVTISPEVIPPATVVQAAPTVVSSAPKTKAPAAAPATPPKSVEAFAPTEVIDDLPVMSGGYGKLSRADYKKYIAEDKGRLVANGGCMSELLIQGIRCTGTEIRSFIDPHEAHSIFCDGNAEALKSRKTEFESKIAEYRSCSEKARAAAKAAGPSKRYEYERLTEQLQRINAGSQALVKCGAVISSGKKIASKNTGTLDFNSNVVKYTGNGRAGVVDKLNITSSLGVLSQWGLGARFCDYAIVPKPGSTGTGATASEDGAGPSPKSVK